MRDTARPQRGMARDRDALGEVDPAGSRVQEYLLRGRARRKRAGGATDVSLPSGALLYIEGYDAPPSGGASASAAIPANFPDIDQCLWMAESFYNRPPARSEAPSQKGFTARLSTECRLSTASDGVPDGLACPATIHRSDDERLSTSQDGHEAPGPCTECLPLPVLVRKSRAISCGTDVSLVISHADSAWGSHLRH